MKILTILGSPKINGNTAAVLGMFEGLVREDHELERVDIASGEVRGCLGCYCCRGVVDEPGCVQEDDVLSIFGRMMDSDLIIYATPLYSWSFPSQMKAFIDRHVCLINGYGPNRKSLLAGKSTALLVTCAGPAENNADLIQEIFDRFNEFLQCRNMGKYIVPSCRRPDSIGKRGMDVAGKMVADIACLIGDPSFIQSL